VTHFQIERERERERGVVSFVETGEGVFSASVL
jgi:hypothetical protein